jgi:thiol-disulfide isomerase/thioredoxin
MKILLRASVISLALSFVVLASPHMGFDDTPTLPMPDGSGDIPEIAVKLVKTDVVQAASQPDELKLSSLRGKVVLLDIFASWCPHCQEHAPHIVELYNQYKQRGFTVLGLATDRDDKAEDVKTFARNAKANFPIGFMTTEIVAYYCDSHNQGVPQMILFGPDGKLVSRQTGWEENTGKDLKQLIETQLAKLPAQDAANKAGQSGK